MIVALLQVSVATITNHTRVTARTRIQSAAAIGAVGLFPSARRLQSGRAPATPKYLELGSNVAIPGLSVLPNLACPVRTGHRIAFMDSYLTPMAAEASFHTLPSNYGVAV